MASQASFAASTLPPGSEHGFLTSFQREVRDQIYDLLYEEDEEHDEFYVRATYPLTALHLINRQFRLEYNERCNKIDFMSQLLFKGITAYTFAHCPNRLPLSPHITNLTVEMRACRRCFHPDHPCLIVQNSLIRCGKRIGDLIKQFPRLRWIRVYLTLHDKKCLHATLQSLHCLTRLGKMVEVKVLRPGYKDAEGVQYLATWTKEHGVEVDEEAALLCDEQILAGQ